MASDKIKEVPPRVLERVLRSLAPFLLSVFLPREGAEAGAGSAAFFPAFNTIVITRLLASRLVAEMARVYTSSVIREFEVHTRRSKIGGKRVAKAMPADCLAVDSGPPYGGTDDFLEQRIRR